MNLRFFLVGAIASLLVAVNADVKMINHDQVQPFAQPEPTTDSEKTAVKYKPQLYISDGCHPYPAVQADGPVSAGLKWAGWADGDCKGSGLGSQVYSRSDWFRGEWAIMYAWYFPKGRQPIFFRLGHRHFWSYAIVWLDSDKPHNSTILGVSVSLKWTTYVKLKYVIDGTTIKFDSFFDVFGYKFTEESGEIQDLITWEQLTDKARTALSEADFEVYWPENTDLMPMDDKNFFDSLRASKIFHSE